MVWWFINYITPPPTYTHKMTWNHISNMGSGDREERKVERQEGKGGGHIEMLDGLPVDCEEELGFRMRDLGVQRRRYWAWWFLSSQLSMCFHGFLYFCF